MNSSLKKSAGLLVLASVIFAGSASAQHGNHGGGYGQSRSFDRGGNVERRSGGFAQSPSYGRQNNGSFDRQNRQPSFDQRTASVTPRQNRTFDNGGGYSRGGDVQRTIEPRSNGGFDRQASRNVTVYNTTRVNNINRYPSSRIGYNSRVIAPRYSYVPRRYVYVGAPRYNVLPRGYLSIRFGGYPYYYYDGLFYNYYNGFYEPVYAPIGIHVTIIPGGCYPIFVGPTRYYYYSGVYYRQYSNNDYEVVDAPVGAQVSVLPQGAKAVTVNGEKFYEFNGTYYKEGVNDRNQVVYTVVGKYGNINNTEEAAPQQAPATLQMGDTVTTLPEGSREVVINGEHLYVSPDNTYFRAQSIDGEISYKVVGTQYNN
jgi:hypothetical protein